MCPTNGVSHGLSVISHNDNPCNDWYSVHTTFNTCYITITFQDPNFNPGFNRFVFKKSHGTPNSQLVTVTENIKGAMLDHNGQLVVRAVDL